MVWWEHIEVSYVMGGPPDHPGRPWLSIPTMVPWGITHFQKPPYGKELNQTPVPPCLPFPSISAFPTNSAPDITIVKWYSIYSYIYIYQLYIYIDYYPVNTIRFVEIRRSLPRFDLSEVACRGHAESHWAGAVGTPGDPFLRAGGCLKMVNTPEIGYLNREYNIYRYTWYINILGIWFSDIST
jgi:hypothetical protein